MLSVYTVAGLSDNFAGAEWLLPANEREVRYCLVSGECWDKRKEWKGRFNRWSTRETKPYYVKWIDLGSWLAAQHSHRKKKLCFSLFNLDTTPTYVMHNVHYLTALFSHSHASGGTMLSRLNKNICWLRTNTLSISFRLVCNHFLFTFTCVMNQTCICIYIYVKKKITLLNLQSSLNQRSFFTRAENIFAPREKVVRMHKLCEAEIFKNECSILRRFRFHSADQEYYWAFSCGMHRYLIRNYALGKMQTDMHFDSSAVWSRN